MDNITNNQINPNGKAEGISNSTSEVPVSQTGSIPVSQTGHIPVSGSPPLPPSRSVGSPEIENYISVADEYKIDGRDPAGTSAARANNNQPTPTATPAQPSADMQSVPRASVPQPPSLSAPKM